jgi:DNA polymerase-3 subunit delta
VSVRLEAQRIEGFLRDPGATRAVLLYGDDAGLISERAGRLTRVVAGAIDDPFRVTDLDREVHRRMLEEVRSPSLAGGRRVVRVRDAGDSVAALVESALAEPEAALLVLEAPGLPARSRLRALIERASDAVAIGCYPLDASRVASEIRAGLEAFEVVADADAIAWLETRLGSDAIATRAEVLKLALYAGSGGRIDLAAAHACVGDLAAITLDDAIFAATAGDRAATDRALDRALAEGVAPVAALRAAIGHVQRLQRVVCAVADGRPLSAAMRELRPPVFFRREPAFRQALQLWSGPRLSAAAATLWIAEGACKRTAAPADSLCRRAFADLACGVRNERKSRDRTRRQSRESSATTPSS